MKAISMRQPWASMTAAGLRDVDVQNRDTKYRGSVLLHASSRRVSRDFGADVPAEQLCRVRNAQMMGFIPYDEEMPVSAVVGYARLVECAPQMVDSVWSGTGVNWVLEDARLFDTPIPGIKGKQGLFDVNELQDIEHLPSHELPAPWSDYADGVFSLSMSDVEIERQWPELPLVVMLCGDALAYPLFEASDPERPLRQVKQLRLVSSTTVAVHQVRSVTLATEEVAGHTLRYVAIAFEARS